MRPDVSVRDGASEFLSSNAQDFIEDVDMQCGEIGDGLFLSSNAQDFIEED